MDRLESSHVHSHPAAVVNRKVAGVAGEGSNVEHLQRVLQKVARVSAKIRELVSA